MEGKIQYLNMFKNYVFVGDILELKDEKEYKEFVLTNGKARIYCIPVINQKSRIKKVEDALAPDVKIGQEHKNTRAQEGKSQIQNPNNQNPTSNFQNPTSNFQNPTSNFPFPISNFSIIRVRIVRNEFDEDDFSYALKDGKVEGIEFKLKEIENNNSSSPKLENCYYEANFNDFSMCILKSPFRIIFKDAKGNEICSDYESGAYAFKPPKKSLPKNEHKNLIIKKSFIEDAYFGLGEKTAPINKRGFSFEMRNKEPYGYIAYKDPLYQSHPFFITLKNETAYGIFFDNSYHSKFDMAGSNPDIYWFGASGGEINYYFFYGPSIEDVIFQYTYLVGRMPLPPKWALGCQQSRFGYKTQKHIKDIAETYRRKKIPCDVIYADIDYMDNYKIFTWHPKRFSSPKNLTSFLRKKGFKLVVIVDPGPKKEDGYQIFEEGNKKDFFIKNEDGSLYEGFCWPGTIVLPDFSKDKVQKWWGDLQKFYIDSGVSGIWLDMNEPASYVPSSDLKISLSFPQKLLFSKIYPDKTIFYDRGKNSRFEKMNNIYALLENKATSEGLQKITPDKRPFILTRSGFSGVQRYSAMWTGDNTSAWSSLRASVRMLLSLHLTGYSFCGDDVGGFAGVATPELFARWVQFSIFNPLFRIHNAHWFVKQEPWTFGKRVENISKKYMALRYKLMPYLYSLMYESSVSGKPVNKPLFYFYLTDKEALTCEDEFFFGDNMLIAPVIWKGTKDRLVYLPEGKWINFWSNEFIIGPSKLIIKTPLDYCPIFIKSGAIIPFGPTMQYVDEQPPDPLFLYIFPNEKKSTFILYEDDGISLNYKNGDYLKTTFSIVEDDESYTFTVENIEGNYKPDRKKLILGFKIQQPKGKVMINDNVVEISSQPKLLSSYEDLLQSNPLYAESEKTLYLSLLYNREKFTVKIFKIGQ